MVIVGAPHEPWHRRAPLQRIVPFSVNKSIASPPSLPSEPSALPRNAPHSAVPLCPIVAVASLCTYGIACRGRGLNLTRCSSLAPQAGLGKRTNDTHTHTFPGSQKHPESRASVHQRSGPPLLKEQIPLLDSQGWAGLDMPQSSPSMGKKRVFVYAYLCLCGWWTEIRFVLCPSSSIIGMGVRELQPQLPVALLFTSYRLSVPASVNRGGNATAGFVVYVRSTLHLPIFFGGFLCSIHLRIAFPPFLSGHLYHYPLSGRGALAMPKSNT